MRLGHKTCHKITVPSRDTQCLHTNIFQPLPTNLPLVPLQMFTIIIYTGKLTYHRSKRCCLHTVVLKHAPKKIKSNLLSQKKYIYIYYIKSSTELNCLLDLRKQKSRNISKFSFSLAKNKKKNKRSIHGQSDFKIYVKTNKSRKLKKEYAGLIYGFVNKY